MSGKSYNLRPVAILLCCAAIVSSWQFSSGKKGGQQNDTTIAQVAPRKVSVITTRADEDGDADPYETFVVLDTIVGRDTVRFVLFDDSLISCSINNLRDTFNSGGKLAHWDSSFANKGLIMVPGRKRRQELILNDSILIVPVHYGFMSFSEGVALFLLNRTRASLKFARGDENNPIRFGSHFPYVDIKGNQVISCYYRQMYNDQDAGNGGDEHGRYELYRFRIEHKQFVKTNYAVSCSKELERVPMYDPEDSDLMAFYTLIAQHEDWLRDRYDSSNIQRIEALSVTTGKNKMEVWYDNKGNVACSLNGKGDTVQWGEKWVGYEWWREKAASRMVVPDKRAAEAFILNDSLLLFTIMNSQRKAVVFLYDRKRNKLDRKMVNTFANYVYTDLKHNTILSYVDSEERVDLKDTAEQFPHTQGMPYVINKYSIGNGKFTEAKAYQCNTGSMYLLSPMTYEDSKSFYGVALVAIGTAKK